MRFPDLEASTVDGRAYRFPRDFAGGLTIAAVAFRIEHRAEVESWVPAIEKIVTTRPGIRGLAFAILPPMMRLGRGPLFATMRQAMSAKQREVSVVAFVAVGKFTRALGISDREPVVLLVAPDGTVLRRYAGHATPEAVADLETAFASV